MYIVYNIKYTINIKLCYKILCNKKAMIFFYEFLIEFLLLTVEDGELLSWNVVKCLVNMDNL